MELSEKVWDTMLEKKRTGIESIRVLMFSKRSCYSYQTFSRYFPVSLEYEMLQACQHDLYGYDLNQKGRLVNAFNTVIAEVYATFKRAMERFGGNQDRMERVCQTLVYVRHLTANFFQAATLSLQPGSISCSLVTRPV